MKNKINIFSALLFLAGLSVVLYPFVSNAWNTYRQKQLIIKYEEQLAEKAVSEKIANAWEKAHTFNENLLPMILPDSFAEAELTEEDKEYLSCLNINDDSIMGVVDIPKINISIPIFHTTRESVLELGAGHLQGSSLPVGGEDTHSVISAHRGLPTAALFTDLDKLVEGDHFLLHILDTVLCYEVDQIKEVEPEQTEDLNVIKGEDLVTLLTCTPYGVNTRRLLVRGHRVPYVVEEVEQEENTAGFSVHTNYLAWVIGCVSLALIFTLFLTWREKVDIKKLQSRQENNQKE